MTCPKGHYIPDDSLVCPMCAARKAEAAMHALQLEFLRKAVNHESNYTLRVAKLPQRHVLQYSSYTRTFCGQELAAAPTIKYEPYETDTLLKVCAGCRAAIAAAVEEAMA